MKKLQWLFMMFLLSVVLFGCTSEGVEKTASNDQTVSTSTPTNEKEEDETTSSESSSNQQQQASEISNKPLEVHFIDVGQGDSILIKSPNNKYMLIDGGIKGEGKKVVEYMRSLGVTELQYVVSTHPDADHIGGLIPVLNSIKIKNFVDSGKVHTSQTYEEMLQLIDVKNIPFTVPQTGDQLKLDEEMLLQVISADEQATDNNEASIVLKMTYGEVSFLFTGDAGVEMEQQMLTQNIEATILKAGHHGSNTSSSAAFINKVKPEVTILSYGQDNKYGHPHAEVIDNLRAVKSKIYGTAESGTIVVTTDGITYNVNKNEWTGIGATSSIGSKPSPNQNVSSESKGDVIISSKDLQADEVGITNNSSSAVSLKGWKLVSVEGNQTFNFPNITLEPGKTIMITSGPDAKEGNGYLKWTGRSIWLNDGDAAQLFNTKGDLVSEFD